MKKKMYGKKISRNVDVINIYIFIFLLFKKLFINNFFFIKEINQLKYNSKIRKELGLKTDSKILYYDLDNLESVKLDTEALKPYINHIINTSEFLLFKISRVDKGKLLSESKNPNLLCLILNYSMEEVDDESCKVFDKYTNRKVSFYESNFTRLYLQGLLSNFKNKNRLIKLKNYGKWTKWKALKELKYRLDEEEKRILMQPGYSTLSWVYKEHDKVENVERNFVKITTTTLYDLYMSSMLGDNNRSLKCLESLLGLNNDSKLELVKLSNTWLRTLNIKKGFCKRIIDNLRLKEMMVHNVIEKISIRSRFLELVGCIYELFLQLDYSLEVLNIEKDLLYRLMRKKSNVLLGVTYYSAVHVQDLIKILCNTFMYRVCYIRLLKKEIYIKLSIKDRLFDVL